MGLVCIDDECYFLVGGGIEVGEEKEEVFMCEVLEEMGLLVMIEVFIGIVKEFYLDEIEFRYYEKIGYFYKVVIIG